MGNRLTAYRTPCERSPWVAGSGCYARRQMCPWGRRRLDETPLRQRDLVRVEVARDRSPGGRDRSYRTRPRARDASAGQGRYRVREVARGPARGGCCRRSAGPLTDRGTADAGVRPCSRSDPPPDGPATCPSRPLAPSEGSRSQMDPETDLAASRSPEVDEAAERIAAFKRGAPVPKQATDPEEAIRFRERLEPERRPPNPQRVRMVAPSEPVAGVEAVSTRAAVPVPTPERQRGSSPSRSQDDHRPTTARRPRRAVVGAGVGAAAAGPNPRAPRPSPTPAPMRRPSSARLRRPNATTRCPMRSAEATSDGTSPSARRRRRGTRGRGHGAPARRPAPTRRRPATDEAKAREREADRQAQSRSR